MADVKKMATREGYGRGLVALGAAHEDVVVLDADLAGSTKTGMFAKAYPDRHFNCGIAEADMMCVAAGFAANGFVPFASSFAMFAAGRAFEQIRNSIGYPHLNVKVGATHGGLSVGEDGASHQCIEDMGILSTIPGMTVVMPADYNAARKLTRAAAEFDGPVYLRFTRDAVPEVYGPEQEFVIGKAITLREGTDAAIISIGDTVHIALEAAEELLKQGIKARVLDMHTIKPLDVEAVTKAVNECGKIALRIGGDVRGVGIPGEVRAAQRLDPKRSGQHDHGPFTGNGRIRRHGAIAVSFQNACGGAAVDSVIIPGVRRVIDEACVLCGGQLQESCQNGGELCTGKLNVRVKLAVAALDNAVAAPAFDGGLGPVARGVAVGRLRRACAYREQTDCHGKRKNER